MGVTALEAFAFGIPIVTLPIRQTVPCLVRGMLLVLDIPELVANNEEGYITTAIGIAKDFQRRNDIKTKIFMNIHRLYSLRTQSIQDWTSVLRRLHIGSKDRLIN